MTILYNHHEAVLLLAEASLERDSFLRLNEEITREKDVRDDEGDGPVLTGERARAMPGQNDKSIRLRRGMSGDIESIHHP